jgi:pilus assembly protein Flp/PilA
MNIMLTQLFVMVSVYLSSLKNEEGQGMAEYGLILALVALAAILAFTFLGGEIATLMSTVGTAL